MLGPYLFYRFLSANCVLSIDINKRILYCIVLYYRPFWHNWARL